MPPEKIDSLADDVKPLVLELLRQISELVAQNEALLARIAELEAQQGKPSKTPDNSSLPPSRGRKGNAAEPAKGKKARKGHPGAARALAENPDATRENYAERCACGATLDYMFEIFPDHRYEPLPHRAFLASEPTTVERDPIPLP